jgi:riboflavin synthase alpha subunit
MEEFGPITTEAMLFYVNGLLYEVVASENSQSFSLSFLFEIEKKQKKTRVAKDFMTVNGISITEKPVDQFIDKILENL